MESKKDRVIRENLECGVFIINEEVKKDGEKNEV